MISNVCCVLSTHCYARLADVKGIGQIELISVGGRPASRQELAAESCF